MKEVAPIMTEAEFTEYLNRLKTKTAKELDDGQDYNTIRCRLIGYLQAEDKYAFTGNQLQQIFDLGFSET